MNFGLEDMEKKRNVCAHRQNRWAQDHVCCREHARSPQKHQKSRRARIAISGQPDP